MSEKFTASIRFCVQVSQDSFKDVLKTKVFTTDATVDEVLRFARSQHPEAMNIDITDIQFGLLVGD